MSLARIAILLAALTACGGDVQVAPVTTPPTAEISSPGSSAQVFASGELITFEGLVRDQQDDPDRLTATWISDLDGELDQSVPDAEGRVGFSTVALSEGIHVVTLQAMDTDGEIGEDAVSVQVQRDNHAPAVSIDIPATGDVFVQGDAVLFAGLASDEDPEDPATSLEILWNSDADGPLGGEPPNAEGQIALTAAGLSLGPHIVSVTATDALGATATDQVYIEIVEPNEAPQALISLPASGETVLESAVHFEGRVSDDADRADTLALSWESDLCGLFNWDSAAADGSVSFDTNRLTRGLHTITLSARDSGDLSGSDSIQLNVVGPGDWDADGDGWTPNEGDCDDANAGVNPGAPEICNDVDDDCDGSINEGMGDSFEPNESSPTWLGAMDGDGFCVYYLGYISGSADFQSLSATLHSPDDWDLYSFSTTDDITDCLDESGYGIQVTLSSIPYGHDYALELYWVDGGDVLLASSDNPGSASESVAYTGTYGFSGDADDGGTFEIAVLPSTGSGYGCSDTYTLEIEVW